MAVATGSGLRLRQAELDAHQARVRACRCCVAAGLIAESCPVFHGVASARLMVVGQAPAQRRVERPLPYSGASGRVLKGWLARAGFAPEEFYERFYLTSLTKCFPGPSRDGKGDRAPSAAEIRNCRPHLLGELHLVQPAVILALGRLSTAFFVPEARKQPLAELVGRAFAYEDATVLPLPHPSGVSHWLNAPAHRALLDQALVRLAQLRLEHDL